MAASSVRLGALGTLRVPALKARMGDWTYYAAFLKFKDVAARVSLADEIHQHKGLRDMIQRSIDESKHAESIRQYLVSRPQRFFNSLVIGVYGGEPNFFELVVRSGPQLEAKDLPGYFTGALGILEFSGQEQLFAVDGQHRVVGIKKALAQSESLGDEEVVALFVPHKRSTAGMERSRRLFTTLNRYAKPVSKMDIIALDEDDVVAIVTRMLIENYPLFKKFLKIKKGKPLQRNDVDSFTTIETLYDVLDCFFEQADSWTEYKRARPSDQQIERHYRRALELWETVQRHFPAVRQLARSQPDSAVAGRFRGSHGGHLLFRPMGLLLAVESVKELMDHGVALDAAIRRLARVPMDLSHDPWRDLLWNSTSSRIISAADNKRVASWILYHGLGGRLSDIGVTAERVREEWGGIVNRPAGDLELTRWAKKL